MQYRHYIAIGSSHFRIETWLLAREHARSARLAFLSRFPGFIRAYGTETRYVGIGALEPIAPPDGFKALADEDRDACINHDGMKMAVICEPDLKTKAGRAYRKEMDAPEMEIPDIRHMLPNGEVWVGNHFYSPSLNLFQDEAGHTDLFLVGIAEACAKLPTDLVPVSEAAAAAMIRHKCADPIQALEIETDIEKKAMQGLSLYRAEGKQPPTTVDAESAIVRRGKDRLVRYFTAPEGAAHFLSIWTIFKDPKDFPGQYVARRFDTVGSAKGSAAVPAPGEPIVADTLLGARSNIPGIGALTLLPRDPQDHPTVVESWI